FSDIDDKIFYNLPLLKTFAPLCDQLFEVLLKHTATGTDGYLNKVISLTLLMNKHQPFINYLKDFEDKKTFNEAIWILYLILNYDLYSTEYIFNQLIEDGFFRLFYLDDLSFISISPDDFICFVIAEIDKGSRSFDEIYQWFYEIKPAFYNHKQVGNKKGQKGNNSQLNVSGKKLFHTLSGLLSTDQRKHEKYYLHLLFELISPLDNFDNLNEKDLSILKFFCNHRLTTLRKIVRGMDILPEDPDYMKTCYYAGWILSRLEDRVKVIKSLLTTFRHISENTLVSNLESYKSRNFNIYSEITFLIHILLDQNSTDDGVLIRKELTEFMVKKLKPLKKKDPERKTPQLPDHIDENWDGWSEDYTEPDPVWRYAYVRAIKDLGIHSRGKKHYYAPLMKKVAESDPSKKVRAIAAETAEELNNLRNGFAAGSSKRRLLQAWWWIRQAHVITLGGTIDPEGAQKIRVTEVR
ncbi:MAG: hypothetical protein PF518_02585, partial [Spirochaetaceae bacterium]|nr:hypothetical protein [Spirochaetaceae bacterium]